MLPQHFAVIVAFCRGTDDVALGFVVVEGVGQAAINKETAMLPAAVEGQGVAVDVDCVATVGLHIGGHVAVGQPEGSCIIQLAIEADSDPVGIGIVTLNARALVLVGAVVQDLSCAWLSSEALGRSLFLGLGPIACLRPVG